MSKILIRAMLSKNNCCINVHNPQPPLASVRYLQLPKFSHLVPIDDCQWLMTSVIVDDCQHLTILS